MNVVRNGFLGACMLVCFVASAQNNKSFKLEFYNANEYKDYADITVADKQLLEPVSFVCEVVNTFDPDMRYEVVVFDVVVKTKGAEQQFLGLSESELLDKIKQIVSAPDGSPVATVAVINVSYLDANKKQKSMSVSSYGYELITVH